MADRLLIDLDAAELPLGLEELEELRWYLEDYLRTPYGVYEGRGARIAGQLPAWGEAMFAALSGTDRPRAADPSGPSSPSDPSDLAGLADLADAKEIVLRSSDPSRLAQPWELLRAPGSPAPPALDGVSLSRVLAQPLARPLEDSLDVAGERLRVLMVISRPAGARDVGFRMIARPLLRRLETVRGRVDVEVLRPPTLEDLAARLQTARENGEPFQIVHFDGHGTLPADARREGVLVFEKPGGGADPVPAGRIAQVLAEAEVPVVVLNACESGAVGKRLEAAVATRLLAGGTSAVVAMAYRVYAAAAAEFMTAFYESLFAGGSVGEAVTAGRRRMALSPGRPSPKGELPLADWAVPVLYRNREVRFPRLRETEDTVTDRASAAAPEPEPDPLAPEEEFVGRDDLFHSLEVAARTARVVVLHGPAGAGKTEAAKAFGRWWRDTGGVDGPESVVWHSFEPGVASFGLEGVIIGIGTRVHGPDFAMRDPAARRELVGEALRTRRLLLIWDNFESVATMPDPSGATAALDEAGRREIGAFLDDVAARGRGTVLVTSRTPEPWLGPGVHRLAVGGLARHEAVDYADRLLARYPAAAARRAERTFADLLEWLDGHPLSMRLTLPHLASISAAELLAGLRGAQPLPGNGHRDGHRTESLTASIAYSLDQLNPDDLRLLPAITLQHGFVDVAILAVFCGRPETPDRFRGADVPRWKDVLELATHVGLLTSRGRGRYAVHPALPADLAARWRADAAGAYAAERDAAERLILDVYCAYIVSLRQEDELGQNPAAYEFADLHRSTLGHLLGFALDNGVWDRAWIILSLLDTYLNRRHLGTEAAGWAERARLAALDPDGLPPSADGPAGMLWRKAVGSQAVRLTRAGDLDGAEAAYTAILGQPRLDPEAERHRPILAGVYSGLGIVAARRGRQDEAERWQRLSLGLAEESDERQGVAEAIRRLGALAERRGQWDEAEARYRRSLVLAAELGEQHSMALAYDELGDLAIRRGRLAEAEEWYHKSLAIAERRSDREGTARAFFSLGRVAELRRHFDVAEQLYHRALAAAEMIGDRPGMAVAYHQLGIVAMHRGQDECELWHSRSLELKEQLDDRHGMALSLLQLGVVAAARENLDEAERRFRRALGFMEELGDKEGASIAHHALGGLAVGRERWDEAEHWLRLAMAAEQEMGHLAGVGVSCIQLSQLEESRGRFAEALSWTVRCAVAFQDFPHLASQPSLRATMARLTGRLGLAVLEQSWRDVTGAPLPSAIRLYVETHEEFVNPTEGR